MKLDYAPDVPPEIRAAIEPLIDRWAHLAPTWLHGLCVHYEPDLEEGDDSLLSMDLSPEYRVGHFYVHPGWICDTDDLRERNVIHELLHAALQPMSDAFEALAEATTEEGSPLRKWADERLRSTLEEAVCDLTHSITGNRAEA